jgi:hypothetical protein
MTTPVVEQAATENEPVRPILLMLNCSQFAGHLGENNPDLYDLFGVRLVRIAIDVPKRFITRDVARHEILALLEEFSDTTYQTMTSCIENDWLFKKLSAKILQEFRKKASRRSLEVDAGVEHVKLIYMCDEDTIAGSLLEEALPEIFTNATFRAVDTQNLRPHKATRIWRKPKCHLCSGETVQTSKGHFSCRDAKCEGTLHAAPPASPLCMNCGTKMRASGSCFICDTCGATSGCS